MSQERIHDISTRVPPGATIGIIGGGQLGRMLALAAAPLGYRTHIFDPDPECCAAQVSSRFTCASFGDAAALAHFASQVDVATYEFENIACAPLEAVAAAVPLAPTLRSLSVAQDRIAEKIFAAELGVRTAPWHAVEQAGDLARAVATIGLPAILKTARFGYDGKGQVRLNRDEDVATAWAALQGAPAILEGVVAFDHEFSVLLARGRGGEIVFWDSPENHHRQGILIRSTVPPSPMVRDQQAEAREAARRIAIALDHVGVLAIEFFAGAEGPVFNEMAPRVHNSGHWTIEGSESSQFENHIRALCGLPLGCTALTHPFVEMTNLIGRDVDQWDALVADSRVHLHFYGKDEPRSGRKMAHVTRVFPVADPAR